LAASAWLEAGQLFVEKNRTGIVNRVGDDGSQEEAGLLEADGSGDSEAEDGHSGDGRMDKSE
jgi:hypothetical protein